MPIHDQSYRRYQGQRDPRSSRWMIIALAGMRTLIRKRVFIGLLLFAWIPFLVRAVQVYVAANFSQAAPLLAATADTYRRFLGEQGTFIFFVTIYVGAGLIANDRRANALQIYLSKPITRAEYVAGKFAILAGFLFLVTLVPGLLLLLLQAMFEGSFQFVRRNLFLVPAITLFSTIQVLVASFTMLALSSLSKSARYVAVMYAGVLLFTDAMFAALRLITGGTRIAWISFPANLDQLGDVIFQIQPRYETPWPVSLIVIVGLVVVSISVLDRRIRGMEVVA